LEKLSLFPTISACSFAWVHVGCVIVVERATSWQFTYDANSILSNPRFSIYDCDPRTRCGAERGQERGQKAVSPEWRLDKA